MYEENYLTRPGGFTLPVALLREQVDHYETAPQIRTPQDLTAGAGKFTKEYLHSQMIAGRILDFTFQLEENPALLVYNGSYKCLEMIGVQREEEILGPYGKHNR